MEEIKLRKGTEVEVKRFYLPGVLLRFKCKNCGELMENDYSSQYISYPQIGEQVEHFYCDECGTNHEMIIDFEILIRFDRKTLKIS